MRQKTKFTANVYNSRRAKNGDRTGHRYAPHNPSTCGAAACSGLWTAAPLAGVVPPAAIAAA